MCSIWKMRRWTSWVEAPINELNRMPTDRIAAVMVHTTDPDAALAWYQRAFPSGKACRVGEQHVAALDLGQVRLEFVHTDAKAPAGPGSTVVYWQVDPFEPELRRLLSIGAVLYRGPMRIENEQAMCQVQDPWGNCLGIRGNIDA
jgi:uncharacterized protein